MIQVKVDQASLARLNQRLRDYAAVTKQTASDCVKEQAQLMCEDIANLTPPVLPSGGGGLTNKAQVAGNEAVSGDIRKMFVAVGSKNTSSQMAMVMMNMAYATQSNNIGDFNAVVAKAPIQAMQKLSPVMRKILNDQNHERAFAKAKNYLQRVKLKTTEYGVGYEYDLKTTHNRIKGKFGGRIKKGQRIGEPRRLVESEATLKAYVAERQLMVGRIKSGWLTALKAIPSPSINGKEKNFGAGLRKADNFIQRHHSSAGYCRVIINDRGFKLIIGNAQGDVNDIATEANVLNLAIANREKQMAARIKTRMMGNAQKSNASAPKKQR